MCFFVTESSFMDQPTIRYYHFCSNTVISMKSNWEWNKRKLEALTDVVGTILGSYKRKNKQTTKQTPLKLKCLNWAGIIGELLLSHLSKKPPKSHQQLSIVLQDWYEWIPTAPNPGIISLLIWGVFPCSKGGKKPKEKKKIGQNS